MGRNSQKEETPFQREVFNIYYSMGNERSIKNLHSYLMRLKEEGKIEEEVPCERTLKRWSKLFNWQLRIKQKNIEVNKKLNEQLDEDVLEIKANYRNIIRTLLEEQMQILKEYKEQNKSIQIKGVRDLREIVQMVETLINLDLELIGEKEGEQIKIVISNELLPEGYKKGGEPVDK